jgi:hypothetical protein
VQSQFRADIWPHLKQLFVVAPNDSPENALSLLEHLPALQKKSDAAMFKEEIGPLMLSLLSSTHAPLLVKTLQTIPSMCGGREEADKHALDFVTVRDAVFPEVSKVFVHTTVLGVKVAGLVCLGGMVSVLDKYTLQEKLAPLLSKIRTKDPKVLIASLNVFSLLAGRLTDPMVLSTLILPQLWTMSAAPLLTADQFNRFMALIDGLSRTVKEERGKELRAAARSVPEEVPVASNLTWEELVRGGNQKSQARASNDGVLTPDESKWSNGVSRGYSKGYMLMRASSQPRCHHPPHNRLLFQPAQHDKRQHWSPRLHQDEPHWVRDPSPHRPSPSLPPQWRSCSHPPPHRYSRPGRSRLPPHHRPQWASLTTTSTCRRTPPCSRPSRNSGRTRRRRVCRRACSLLRRLGLLCRPRRCRR